MTALALAGTGGGSVAPDLVLPPALSQAEMDVTPCTRCGLRGHVAGDPDRCLYYRGGFGLGGSASAAQDQAQWRGDSRQRHRRARTDPFHHSDKGAT